MSLQVKSRGTQPAAWQGRTVDRRLGSGGVFGFRRGLSDSRFRILQGGLLLILRSNSCGRILRRRGLLLLDGGAGQALKH